MDSISLFPGEERCVSFRDANGVQKVHYTYCSIRGKLFNCTCCTRDEAQRLCEDWLVKQDRCYINQKTPPRKPPKWEDSSAVFVYRVCVFSVVSFPSAKNRSTFFCARTNSCISFRALR